GKRFGQFVSDQNDGAASISKGPEPFEQIPALRGRENGSGLVHDQHLRATSESFQDLESLLSSDAQRFGSRHRIDRELGFRSKGADPCYCRIPGEPAATA